MQKIDCFQAIRILRSFQGKNLYDLAQSYGISILSENGQLNRGWAGQVCERILGLQQNSKQKPDFGSWELKSIPIKWSSLKKCWIPKETMAITMIDPENVAETPFEKSHLKAKLEKTIIIARTVGTCASEPSFVHKVFLFDLNENENIKNIIKYDYELIRDCIRDPLRGKEYLRGEMGVYIQPRTKGKFARAFYARINFLSLFI